MAGELGGGQLLADPERNLVVSRVQERIALVHHQPSPLREPGRMERGQPVGALRFGTSAVLHGELRLEPWCAGEEGGSRRAVGRRGGRLGANGAGSLDGPWGGT